MADLNSQENVGRIGELISGFKIPIDYRSKLQENQTYENKDESVSMPVSCEKAEKGNYNIKCITMNHSTLQQPQQKKIQQEILEQSAPKVDITHQETPQLIQQISRHLIKVNILEQPASNRLRFRYDCEGRSAGAMQGVSSTSEFRTFPKIQIKGYQGQVVIVVSCVEDKPPYRAHPNKLVGKNCTNGVCKVEVNESGDMTTSFPSLGVRCVKRDGILESLTQRENMKIDPFKQGFRVKTGTFNLNAIRLCFQPFIMGPSGSQPIPATPVVSDVIFDRKSHGDLNIVDFSPNWSLTRGGTKILLLCEKVSSKDIEVRFEYTDKRGERRIVIGNIAKQGIHKQCGISVETPKLPSQNLHEKIKAKMYLFKPSERSQSEPCEFYFYPNTEDMISSMPPLILNEIPKVEAEECMDIPYPPGGLYTASKYKEPKPEQDHESFTQKILNMCPNELEKTFSNL